MAPAELPASGVYVLQVRLDRPRRLAVGALGPVRFDGGVYLYVGRALRGLPSRIARHCRRQKPLRWHIDWLTSVAPVTAVTVWPPDPALECRLASMLGAALPSVRAFGASDCRCPGHLFTATGPLERGDLPLADRIVLHWTADSDALE